MNIIYGIPKPKTLEEAWKIIVALVQHNNELTQRNNELVQRINELEAKLNKNSRNSNKPPSSDGLGKPPRTQSLREPSFRPPGGQHGHPGKHLALVSNPNKIVRHQPHPASFAWPIPRQNLGGVAQR